MRKLASIRIVNLIIPIPGADAIELVQVDGWRVITKKGEYAPGDKCIYLEIDSWVPNTVAPFLSKGKVPRVFNGIPGEKLKTVKMKGALSQGLVLPMNLAPPEFHTEGTDVTELLGIQKWEPPEEPATLRGAMKGMGFPRGIPKTDLERVQNLHSIPCGEVYQLSLKLDGSSCTLLHDLDGALRVFSRNVEYKLDDPSNDSNAFVQVAKRWGPAFIAATQPGMALRGEVMGPKIQGNRENFTSTDIWVFDVWDENRGLAGEYALSHESVELARVLGMNHVPILQDSWMIPQGSTVESLLQFADATQSINNPVAEGIVFKHLTTQDRFKVISNRFLLKEKDQE
jgi:RNA ligase (TIGR02306 family)